MSQASGSKQVTLPSSSKIVAAATAAADGVVSIGKSKSAFDWDVYKNRRTALQHLKRNLTLVDTIIETEDGCAHELVHSQVMSAFGDKLTEYMSLNSIPIGSQRESEQHTTKQYDDQQTKKTLSSNHHQTTISRKQQESKLQQHSSVRTQQHLLRLYEHHNRLVVNQQHNATNKLRLVRLVKVNRYTLGILVECAYTGYIRTDLTSGGIWQVLEVADFYQMPDVIRACCEFLKKNLNQTNCIHFYHIGKKHNQQLLKSAWHHIRAHFKHILAANLGVSCAELINVNHISSLRWPLVRNNNQACATNTTLKSTTTNNTVRDDNNQKNNRRIENNLATISFSHFEILLKNDRLNIDYEESIWVAIQLWCNYDLNHRAECIPHLLQCMRFPRFRHGTDFSLVHMWRNPLILNYPLAQQRLAILDRNHRDFIASASTSTIVPIVTSARRYSMTSNAIAAAATSIHRDGFNLPCAVKPIQLRPRIPHSILLAIGGWQQGHPTTSIESYDSNCNLWFECKRKITSPLAYHGIEYINGLLYICGGTDGSDILNELFTFDPIGGDCLQRKSMRELRCYVSTAHLFNYLYAMGGHNGSHRLRSVERYDLQNDIWAHVQEMNVARSDASACVYNELIYIAGGLNDQVIERSVEFYNPSDNSWTFITAMLIPRTSFTLLNYRNTLLAIGGNNGFERLNSVEQYDFNTKIWSSHSQMRHKRSTFSAALVDENKLIVVGGYDGQRPFAQVETYDELSGQWILLHKIGYDRSGLKAVVVKDLPNAAYYTFLGAQPIGANIQ